jgi:hypothetical protein
MPAIELRRPRRNLSTEARVRALGLRAPEDNPILTIILDMLEAARTGRQFSSAAPLGALYNEYVVKRIPQTHLQRMHENLQSLPLELRRLVAPRDPQPQLPTDLAIERGRLDELTARGVLTSLMNLRAPQGRRLSGTRVNGNVFSPEVIADMDPQAWTRVLRDAVLKDIPLLTLPEKPVLETISPVKDAGYLPGDKITLRVSFPNLPSPAFKVFLCRNLSIDPSMPDWQDYAEMPAKVLNKATPYGTRLQVSLPQSMEMSSHIRVVVRSGGKDHATNKLPIKRKALPETAAVYATPAITQVFDGTALPGHELVFKAHNLGQIQVLTQGKDQMGKVFPNTPTINLSMHVKLYSNVDGASDVKLPVTIIDPSAPGKEGTGRIKLPMDMVPGEFWMQLVADAGVQIGPPSTFKDGAESEPRLMTIHAHQYRLQLNSIRCVDESHAFWEFAGNDEVLASWGGYADANELKGNTRDYAGFNDGTTKPIDPTEGIVHPHAGAFGPIGVVLGMRVNLLENDDADVQATKQVAQAIAELADKIGKELAKMGQLKAAAIAGIVSAVASAVDKIATLFGGTDNLGSQWVAWDAVTLQKRTATTKSFTETLSFHNDDDTGSYELTFTVTRLG